MSAISQGKPTSSPTSTDYLAADSGLLPWLFPIDHKRLGLSHLIAALPALFLVVLTGLLSSAPIQGLERLLSSPLAGARLYSAQGLLLLMVAVPLLSGALGNFVLPLQLGQNNLALPKLSLAGFHAYVAGMVVLAASAATSVLDTGWAFSAPYGLHSGTAVNSAAIGCALIAVSSFLTAASLVATHHQGGRKGASPSFFGWALYAASLVQLVVSPIGALALISLVAERHFGLSVFRPEAGGDPVLFGHCFWLWIHAGLWGAVAGVLGLVSDVISVFARRPLWGAPATRAALISLPLIAVFGWGVHLVGGETSLPTGAFFSLLALLVLVPVTAVVQSWLGTLLTGRVHVAVPLLLALSVAWFAVLTVATSLPLSVLHTAAYLRGTRYETAQFIAQSLGVVVGGVVLGLSFLWPKIAGRRLPEAKLMPAVLLTFIGLNLWVLPEFALGLLGAPAGMSLHLPGAKAAQLATFLGQALYLVGLVSLAMTLLASRRARSTAPLNPYGALGAEWAVASPPPSASHAASTGAVASSFAALSYDSAADDYRPVTSTASEGAS